MDRARWGRPGASGQEQERPGPCAGPCSQVATTHEALTRPGCWVWPIPGGALGGNSSEELLQDHECQGGTGTGQGTAEWAPSLCPHGQRPVHDSDLIPTAAERRCCQFEFWVPEASCVSGWESGWVQLRLMNPPVHGLIGGPAPGSGLTG